MNGFVVRVGCQTLVFQTQSEMMRELDAYLANPEQTEKRFVERFGLKSSNEPVGPTPPLVNGDYDQRYEPASSIQTGIVGATSGRGW